MSTKYLIEEEAIIVEVNANCTTEDVADITVLCPYCKCEHKHCIQLTESYLILKSPCSVNSYEVCLEYYRLYN